jgi:hypothetical protein
MTNEELTNEELLRFDAAMAAEDLVLYADQECPEENVVVVYEELVALLRDCYKIEDHCSRIYEAASGGLISNPQTPPEEVIRAMEAREAALVRKRARVQDPRDPLPAQDMLPGGDYYRGRRGITR